MVLRGSWQKGCASRPHWRSICLRAGLRRDTPLLHLTSSPAGVQICGVPHTGIPPAGVTSSPTHPFSGQAVESQGCSPEDAQTYLLLEHLPFPQAKFPVTKKTDCTAMPPCPSQDFSPKGSTYQEEQGPLSVSAITTAPLTLEWKQGSSPADTCSGGQERNASLS